MNKKITSHIAGMPLYSLNLINIEYLVSTTGSPGKRPLSSRRGTSFYLIHYRYAIKTHEPIRVDIPTVKFKQC